MPPKENPPPTTEYVTRTYITSQVPTTIVISSVVTQTVTPYEPVVPPTYPPKTVIVTLSTVSSGVPPIVTTSIYLPPPPILCLGCYTIPVYLPPSPSGQPPVSYTTPIPVYTAIVPVTSGPVTPTPTGPVPCNPAYGVSNSQIISLKALLLIIPVSTSLWTTRLHSAMVGDWTTPCVYRATCAMQPTNGSKYSPSHFFHTWMLIKSFHRSTGHLVVFHRGWLLFHRLWLQDRRFHASQQLK